MRKSFSYAVQGNTPARTWNGMKAKASSGHPVVDLFYSIGASRGKDILPTFMNAAMEDEEKALRIALWARDAREGAGERKLFRDILTFVTDNGSAFEDRFVYPLLLKVPELGRWDDLFSVKGKYRSFALDMIGVALSNEDKLCAKWMPRKGPLAVELRQYFKVTPKQWRRAIVDLTNVVETQMCAKQWDEIDFNKVPSVAGARYKKAFGRHTPKYGEWCSKLAKKDPSVKVNAGAVYPYDVLKGVGGYQSTAEKQNVIAQWDALPNYIGDGSVLPLVDVSGSMAVAKAGGRNSTSGVTCLDVAVSLGLYCADKNKGAFNGLFCHFSGKSVIQHLTGDILSKVQQMKTAHWDMNTDLHAAFVNILKVAVDNGVPPEDMPKILMIFSDMQFDQCVRYDDSAIEMIRRKYERAGYEVPKVVFWNLNDAGNTPVCYNENGVALVSGFSPSVMKAVLSADMEKFTPEAIMLETIMKSRYELVG